jgi:ribosomal protein L37AE/L43A
MKLQTEMQEDSTMKIPEEIIRRAGVLVNAEMEIEGEPSGTITIRPKVQRRDFCQSCFKTISTINWTGIRICRECYAKITGRVWVDLTPEQLAAITKNEPKRLRNYVVYEQLRELDDIERLYGEPLPYDELYWFIRLRNRTPMGMVHGDYADMYEDLVPSLDKREKDRIAALEVFSDKYRLDYRGARDYDSFGISTYLNWRLSEVELKELRQIMGGKA